MVALRAVFARTANCPAASEYSAPAAMDSAVLSTASPTQSPYAWSLMPNARPMSGNTNRLTAPSARIAAIAYDASSSSASMAPFAAMIAETPQTDDPIDRRLTSFGDRPNARPSAVISTMAAASSMATHARLTPPSRTMSPIRKRTPSRTMPALSQNSYVSTPARNTAGMPTEFETTRPKMIAQSTYS